MKIEAKEARRKVKVNLGYWRMQRIQISYLLCVDDMVIMAEKRRGLYLI